ncbi:MAG: hypothetical protein SPI74_00805 [Eubacterium sp.]|nr:hypothetical protein [Eubacterium sp.]
MNAVGKIGKLIVEYQYEIEIALLSLLALIILIWLIRTIARAVRRKDVLTEIKTTVSDIDNTVKIINQKQEALIDVSCAQVSTACESECASECVADAELQNRAKAGMQGCEHVNNIHEEQDFGESFELKDKQYETAKVPEEELPLCKTSGADTEPEKNSKLNEALINIKSRTIEDRMQCAENSEPRKFVNRECGTDKYGNVYTEEFLSKQIK